MRKYLFIERAHYYFLNVNFIAFRLKEQLLKEQRDHAEAISDVEKVSVQEKERLKKEIITRVEETKREMSNTLKEHLHSVSSYILH